MPNEVFSREEIANFLTRFERTPNWTDWDRARDREGRDVLRVCIAGRRRSTLSLTKSGGAAYTVDGLDCWGPTEFQSFDSLLSTTTRLTARADALV